MSKLYPNHRPIGIKADWDHTSLSVDDAAWSLHRYGGRAEIPVEAVAWWSEDGALRRLVADYADGRRADLAIKKGSYRLTYTTPEQVPA